MDKENRTSIGELRRRFLRSMKCGTGEAYILMRDNPSVDFTALLRRGALTNWAYDPQVEGSRAHYMNQLLKLSPKRERIAEEVLGVLREGEADFHDLCHIFQLSLYFAREGVAGAKEAILQRYVSHTNQDDEFCGRYAVLELGGGEGLALVAETLGRWMDPGGTSRNEGLTYILEEFRELHPQIDPIALLKRRARTNELIRRFYRSLLAEQKSPSKSSFSSKRSEEGLYERIRRSIETRNRFLGPSFVIQRLKKRDRLRLAADFRGERDPLKREGYLQIFSVVKYPGDREDLFRIASGKESRRSYVHKFACSALRFFRSPEVRRLALERLPRSSHPELYLPLLISNYGERDSALLAKIAEAREDPDRAHDLALSFIDIYTENPTKGCRRPLERLYERLTCGLHRVDLLRILHKNGVLSDEILRQLPFDSYDDVRDLYKKLKRKRRAS